jgi:hypothetical protein
MKWNFKISTTILLVLFQSEASVAIDLNENCMVNILNRTVSVSENGFWAVPNIPSTMGNIRARVNCTFDGKPDGSRVFVTNIAKHALDIFDVVPAGVSFVTEYRKY